MIDQVNSQKIVKYKTAYDLAIKNNCSFHNRNELNFISSKYAISCIPVLKTLLPYVIDNIVCILYSHLVRVKF